MPDEDFELSAEDSSAGFDGLAPATEAELVAQEAEDRPDHGESPDEDHDLSQPYFAYTNKDGVEEELTGEEILAMIEAQKAPAPEQKEVEVKSAAAETKPAEPAATQEDLGVEPVQWDQVGTNFVTLLEENPEQIGPALKDLMIRMMLTDPDIQGVQRHTMRREMTQEDSAKATFTRLNEDLGSDVTQFVQGGEYQKFRQENPVYAAASPTEALALSVISKLKAEVAQLKAGDPKKEAATKKATEQATLKQLKARGTLRPLRGTGARPAASKQTLNPADPEDRTKGMISTIMRMRGAGG